MCRLLQSTKRTLETLQGDWFVPAFSEAQAFHQTFRPLLSKRSSRAFHQSAACKAARQHLIHLDSVC